MKNLIKILCFVAFSTLLFISCKKEDNKVVLEGGTAPALTASSTNALVLTGANKEKIAVTLNWTNPDYRLNTGVSSQDVSYTLQIDTTGSNFTNRNIQEKTISKELTTSLTVNDLNTFIAKLELQENIPHNMEFRVKSALANNSAILYSNVVKLVVTPYLDVAVPLPTSDKLYLVGNATPGGDATGWNNPVPVPTQQFTKTSSTSWELTINLNGSKEYLILPLNGSWDNKYAVKDKNVSGLSSGGEFGYNLGDNFPGPGAAGMYKIVLNFKTGKFTLTKI